MWGGRFASGPGSIMQEINASIDFDRRLYRQDIAASKAHAAMLAKQGIIARDDAARIAHGLDTILSEMDTGKFRFKRALEDIHMNVESRLSDLIGPAAGRRLEDVFPAAAASLAAMQGDDGTVLVYTDERAARAALAEKYPVLVQMEKYAGGKRTRVIRILEDDD